MPVPKEFPENTYAFGAFAREMDKKKGELRAKIEAYLSQKQIKIDDATRKAQLSSTKPAAGYTAPEVPAARKTKR